MEKSGFQTGCPVASIALSTTPQVPEISAASLAAYSGKTPLADRLHTIQTKSQHQKIAEIIVTLLESGIVRSRIGRSKSALELAGKQAEELVREFAN